MPVRKIFLASSAELKEDREAFRLMVSDLNEQWEPRGFTFKVRVWEHFLDAMAPGGLQQEYNDEIRDQLQAELGLGNVMQVPRLAKIVVNMGVGDAVGQPSLLEGAVADLTVITGQTPPISASPISSAVSFLMRRSERIASASPSILVRAPIL